MQEQGKTVTVNSVWNVQLSISWLLFVTGSFINQIVYNHV